MKRRIVALTLALLYAVAVFAAVLFATPARADMVKEQYVTIVWEMPSWSGPQTPTWPQEIVSHTTTSEPTLDVGTPECGYFQVDVYRYTTAKDQAKVDNLIAGGVLTGPNDPPEPLIPGGFGTAWTFINAGVCETSTPTPTPSETVTPTPSDTPTSTEPTPTPTPTPTDTPSPSASSPTSSPSSTPTISGTIDPPNTAPDPPDTLPRTGASTPFYAGAGALAVILGLLAIAATRSNGKYAR